MGVETIIVFGWGMTWDGDEQLSWRPGVKNEIEESVEVGSTGRRKRGTNEWRWAAILDLGSFTRRRLMVDSVSPAETWEG